MFLKFYLTDKRENITNHYISNFFSYEDYFNLFMFLFRQSYTLYILRKTYDNAVSAHPLYGFLPTQHLVHPFVSGTFVVRANFLGTNLSGILFMCNENL